MAHPFLHKFRFLAWLLLGVSACAAVLLGSAVPFWLRVVLAVVAALTALALRTDFLIDRWMRQNIGSGAGPGDFAKGMAAPLSATACLLLGLVAVFMLLNAPTEGVAAVSRLAAMILGTLAVLIPVGRALLGARRKAPPDPNRQLLERLAPQPLRADLREALEFQRVCGGRLLAPLLALWSVSVVAITAWLGGWGWLAFLLIDRQGGLAWADFIDWPLLPKAAVLLALAGPVWMLPTAAVATLRVVHRMRLDGRLAPGAVWRELGLGVETVGIGGTFGYGLVHGVAVLLLGFSAFGGALLLQAAAGFAWGVALVLGLILIGVCAWVLLLWPQIYLFPLMVRRDAGYLRAYEGSLTLVLMEKRDSLLRGLLSTGGLLVIVLTPAALFLLLRALDHRHLLLARILNEKADRDIDAAINEAAMRTPAYLKKYYDLLEKGRYLDALNGFQMHLHKDPEAVPALRGQSLAYLYIGNPRARESLERWEALADDPQEMAEVAELLEQWYEGRWADDGDLYREADARCTQKLGRGVTGS